MERERFMEIVQNTNMVAAITDALIERLPEDATKYPIMTPYAFMHKFMDEVGEPYRTELSNFRNWYGNMRRYMAEIPDVCIVHSWGYKTIFKPIHTNTGGFDLAILTKDFAQYSIENVNLRIGQKRLLAEILTDKNIPVPFEVPQEREPQDEDKRDAIMSALVKIAKTKPVAFTNVAKEELMLNGFYSTRFKRREVLALIEEMFED